MAENKDEAQKKDSKAKTILADDIEVVGSIKCASDIHMEGRLNGDLTCSGNAVIGESATVKGNISVTSTTVHGQVNGNITAKDKIDLKSTARITGDVRAKRMTVEDGVTIIGKAEVNASGRATIETKSVHDISPLDDQGNEENDEKSEAIKEEIRKNVQDEIKGKSGGLFGKKS